MTEPTLPPLTIARVAALLDAQGATYGTDEDGDLIAAWDGHPFWFMAVGPETAYLQVRGRWAHTVPRSELGALLLTCNDWSQQMLWPKVYVKIVDDVVAVFSELTVSHEHGATDAQLDLQLSTAIGSSLGFFGGLTQRFVTAPDPAAANVAAEVAAEPAATPIAFHDPARPTAE